MEVVEIVRKAWDGPLFYRFSASDWLEPVLGKEKGHPGEKEEWSWWYVCCLCLRVEVDNVGDWNNRPSCLKSSGMRESISSMCLRAETTTVKRLTSDLLTVSLAVCELYHPLMIRGPVRRAH